MAGRDPVQTLNSRPAADAVLATARPRDLDGLRGISGVGAVKLERFGAEFLAVLTGVLPEPMHPARRRLAGQSEAALFDRLLAAQVALARGPDGLGKPLDCTHATLAKIAELVLRGALKKLPLQLAFPDGTVWGTTGPRLQVVRPQAFFHRLGRSGLRRMHDPSLSQRRPRFGCFFGTFSPSRRQMR